MITMLAKHLFKNATISLAVLSFLQNPLIYVDPDSLRDVEIAVIETSFFLLNCLVNSKTTLQTTIPWYFQCTSLLPTAGLQVAFQLIASMILGTNIISFLCHKCSKHSKKGYKYFVFSILYSDLLLVVYCFFVSIANLVYSTQYFANSIVWCSSPYCFTAFALVLAFHLLSPSVHFLLAFARRQLAAHPFESQFKQTPYVCKCLVSTFLATLSLSVPFTICLFLTSGVVPNNLCLPYISHSHTGAEIVVLTALTAFIQSFAAFSILAAHVSLVKEKQRSNAAFRKPKQSSSDRTFLVNLTVLTSLYFLSWLPANIVYIVAHFLPQYPTDMVRWPVVVVTSVNSLVTPWIFTGTMIKSSLKEKKKSTKAT